MPDHSMSGSPAIAWLMISCAFPLDRSSMRSVLCTLYIVEYDSMVFRNWVSSPGLPLNTGMLSNMSLYVCSISGDWWSLYCCYFRYICWARSW